MQLPYDQKLSASEAITAPPTSSSSLCHPPAHTQTPINTAGRVAQNCRITTQHVPICNYTHVYYGGPSFCFQRHFSENDKDRSFPHDQSTGANNELPSLHARCCRAERASGEARSLPRALSPPLRPLPEPRVPFGDPCYDRTSSSILLQANGADCASHFRHGLPLKTTLTRLLLFSLLLQPSSLFSHAEAAIPHLSAAPVAGLWLWAGRAEDRRETAVRGRIHGRTGRGTRRSAQRAGVLCSFVAVGTGKCFKLVSRWQKQLQCEFLSSWPSSSHQAETNWNKCFCS
ncbi:uncharacterized protein LOC125691350 isoform X2 [Lagopus muta]|uniref:uncharacterized protein LOC125691350 isoform X2 n=1 Tax=Lagopus muta TaxID=64668 RepID=UPI00209D1084|nr:uncharacterized protein LOC125691350 isoform X2 [Lagopus muta]